MIYNYEITLISSPMAATSSETTLPTFDALLGEDLIQAFVDRVFVSHDLDATLDADYHLALTTITKKTLDSFVLENLNNEEVKRMYLLRSTNAPESTILNFIQEQIPDLRTQLDDVLEQLYVQESKRIANDIQN